MPLQLLVWLLAFILQSAILGFFMFQLVQLTDLQADFVNPHDAAQSYNKVVVPLYVLQITLTAFMLITGNWGSTLVHGAFLLYMLQQYQRKQHLADVTEMFREANQRKTDSIVKVVFSLLGFIWAVYQFIRVIVVGVLSSSGRQAASALLREAAASMY